MDFLTLPQRLRLLRTERRLSQRDLAARLEVPQGLYSRWETGRQRIPERYLPLLAASLGVEVGVLAEVHVPASHGRRLPAFLSEQRRPVKLLPPYPIRGSVEDMLDLGDVAVDRLSAVQRRLDRPELARVAQHFPRDSAFELAAAFGVLEVGGHLGRMMLAQVQCPILVVEDKDTLRSGAWLMRDVLVLEREELCAILFPQVWVVSVMQSEWYRLDFLTFARRRDGVERWADLEVDDAAHEWATARDERRARGIGLPRLRVWNREVMRRDFGSLLLGKLAWLLDQPEPSFVVQRAEKRAS